MSDHELRSKLIRLAHKNPELRQDLLPIITGERGSSKRSDSVIAARRGEVLEGMEAIEYARRRNKMVEKYSDPIEGARTLTPDEAEDIISDYPGSEELFWVRVGGALK